MMWRSRYSLRGETSFAGCSGMGLFFSGDQDVYFILVIEEVTEGMENLRLGEPQTLGDRTQRIPLLMQGCHVAHGNTETVNHRLATANSRQPNDVRMFSFEGRCHDSLPAPLREGLR